MATFPRSVARASVKSLIEMPFGIRSLCTLTRRPWSILVTYNPPQYSYAAIILAQRVPRLVRVSANNWVVSSDGRPEGILPNPHASLGASRPSEPIVSSKANLRGWSYM
jgi:hypothetical protein